MKEIKKRHHTVDILFVLALFVVFTLTTLVVVYIGSQVYSSTAHTMDIQFQNHVAIDYIVEKVHRNDHGGNIEIKKIDNTDVLCLYQEISDTPYTTYLYIHNQQLKELFMSHEQPFEKENGTALMKVDAMTMTVKDYVLDVSLTINDRTNRCFISLRQGGNSYD